MGHPRDWSKVVSLGRWSLYRNFHCVQGKRLSSFLTVVCYSIIYKHIHICTYMYNTATIDKNLCWEKHFLRRPWDNLSFFWECFVPTVVVSMEDFAASGLWLFPQLSLSSFTLSGKDSSVFVRDGLFMATQNIHKKNLHWISNVPNNKSSKDNSFKWTWLADSRMTRSQLN